MKDKKFMFVSMLVAVFLLTVGLTYAYFNLTVSGNDVAETINVDTTKLELKYTDGKEVKATNIEPGWTMTKTITVENKGSEEAYYTLGWQKLFNEIQKEELVIRSECTSSGVTGGSCDNTDNVVVPQTAEVTAETNKVLYPYKEAALILPGETHTYTVTIEFINYTNKPQNYNQGKKFYGVLGIVPAYNTYNLTLNISNADGTPVANSEVTLHSNPMTGTTDEKGTVIFNDVELGNHSLDINKNNNTINTSIKLMGGTNSTIQTDNKYNIKAKKENITLNVKLSDSDINNLYIKGQRRCSTDEGATTFVDGQYGYVFDSDTNGWHVYLTDHESTDPVTTELCYMINDKYVTDMSGMFYQSQATSIDLGSFDTSNVTSMYGMFAFSQATSLDLSSFDTSNVTDMYGMYMNSQATSINLSSFNTSNVTDMHRMFMNSQATSINLSSFDTSKVTDMTNMFSSSPATSLDLSSFDTSNVTNMSAMFNGSQAITIKGLDNFDTSNVTNMSGMFAGSQATSIKGLNKFDTSKVTDMSNMFSSSPATSLDLSSFDTSNVTNMSGMFAGSQATSIKGLNKFDTSKVTNMSGLFNGSQATSLDLSSFNTSNVTNMSGMFNSSKATSLDLSSFDTSNVTDMSLMFSSSAAVELDLSSFNTSKVNNMKGMFSSNKATNIIGLSNFDTSEVTNMSEMFWDSQATSLDLNSFDTSKVTNMSSMFSVSQATSIDLSSFDTSNVTNMSGMFAGSQARSLDLSSFDTSKVTNMSRIFFSSKVISGYARNQVEADKFNKAAGKTIFTVKN